MEDMVAQIVAKMVAQMVVQMETQLTTTIIIMVNPVHFKFHYYPSNKLCSITSEIDILKARNSKIEQNQ